MCEGLPRGDERPETGIADFVDEMVAALVNVRIYEKDHPRVATSITELRRLHDELLRRSRRGSLVLSTVEDFLVYEGKPLLGASLAANKVIQPLADRGSGGIEFEKGLTEKDLEEALEMLAERVREGDDFDAFNRRLGDRGCRRVSLLPPFQYGLRSTRGVGAGGGSGNVASGVTAGDASTGKVSGTGRPAGAPSGEATGGFMVPVQLYQRVVDSLQGATISICQRGSIELHEVSAVASELLKPLSQSAGAVLSMARYERYDAYTYGHSIRVCALALNFVRELTDDEDLLMEIAVAGLLHDVGKSKVPFEVLHQRGSLTPEMRKEMEKHPELGAEILLDHEGISDLAVAVTFGHHRTLDGGGYPRDALGVKLSNITKIIKICDVYEALTSVRPYKDAMSPTRAYRTMLSMDRHFDPVLLRRFIEVNGIYGAGTCVVLGDGSVARVQRQSNDLRGPVVQLERAPSGDELAEKDRLVLDLSDPAVSGVHSVVEAVPEEGLLPI